MIEANMKISGRFYQTPFAAIKAIRAADIGTVVVINCDANEGEIWYEVVILSKDTAPGEIMKYLQETSSLYNADELLKALFENWTTEQIVAVWQARREIEIHEKM